MKRAAPIYDGDMEMSRMSLGCNNGSILSSCGGEKHRSSEKVRLPPRPSVNAEELVVKELTQLTMRERRGIEEEIHGVSVDNQDPTTELVEQHLQSLQREIDGIRKKSSYERALFMSPSHVQSRDLRLMFLRADRWEPSRAARRMVKYFDFKLELWGLDRLCRDITWVDLDDHDKACLLTGSVWFSNATDQAGRKVVWLCQEREDYDDYRNQIRNVWYQLMTAVKDDETQRNGFVKVVYNVGMSRMPHLDTELLFKGALSLFEALPFKMAAMHYCYDKGIMRPAISTMQRVIGRSGRIRFRAHFGSHLECLYALVSFGIPRKYIPFTDRGELQMYKLEGHIEAIKALETGAASSLSRATIYPKSVDILLGRGRPFQEFPGNIRLALLIDQYRERYSDAGRCDKAIVSRHLVDVVKGSNARFLKRSETGSGEWVEVSDDIASDKISHGFRTKTKRNSTPTVPVAQPFGAQQEGMAQNTAVPVPLPTSSLSVLGDASGPEAKRQRASPLGY